MWLCHRHIHSGVTLWFQPGPYLSYPLRQSVRMKTNRFLWVAPDEVETIATFGDACLVKQLSGKIELIGGTLEDRGTAREWCSLFFHEAVDAGTKGQLPSLNQWNR